MSEENLWPMDALQPTPIRTPSTILREQASALEKASNGLLRGLVQPVIVPLQSTRIIKTFAIIAPLLNNYRYELLQLDHDMFLYPLKVRSHFGVSFEAAGEDEFLNVLKSIFQHPETKRIMNSLVSQSNTK